MIISEILLDLQHTSDWLVDFECIINSRTAITTKKRCEFRLSLEDT